jgi:hypothetical protein
VLVLKAINVVGKSGNDGKTPCRGIRRCRLVGQFPRKSAVDTDEPKPDESLYRRVGQRARAQTIIVGHEVSLYPNRAFHIPEFQTETLPPIMAMTFSFFSNAGLGRLGMPRLEETIRRGLLKWRPGKAAAEKDGGWCGRSTNGR